MTFWIAVAAITVAVVCAMLWPLLSGRHRARQAAEYDLEVYRDQLDEVARSHRKGLIGDAEAESAKAEIGRRILAADRRRVRGDSPSASAGSRWATRAAAAIIVVSVPLGSVWLYGMYGAPGTPDLPLAARGDVPQSSDIAGAGAARGNEQAGGLSRADLARAEQDLTRRVEEAPEDAEAWGLLGQVHMQMGHFRTAADAFHRALELTDSPVDHARYGEAVMMANDGLVTPRARDAFLAAEGALPDDPRPGYYLGLADLQRGNPEDALDRWVRVVAQSPPGAPWLEVVAEQMELAERELGIEPGSTFASVEREAPAAADDGPPALTREQMEAAEDLSPDERRAMIEEMVASLAERLEDDPEDLDGWLRLARSHEVLGQGEEARDAARRASELAPEDVAVLSYYARLSRATDVGGQSAETVAVSRRILELDADNPEALWFVAMHELARGDKATAREKFERALEQMPADAPQTAELRARAERMLADD